MICSLSEAFIASRSVAAGRSNTGRFQESGRHMRRSELYPCFKCKILGSILGGTPNLGNLALRPIHYHPDRPSCTPGFHFMSDVRVHLILHCCGRIPRTLNPIGFRVRGLGLTFFKP